MESMAIEVFRQIAHTYRHDLESFCYILLWICARRTWERQFECKLDLLTKWYTGSFDDTTQMKKNYMYADDFDKIFRQSPRSFDVVKSLYRETRAILGPSVLPILRPINVNTGV